MYAFRAYQFAFSLPRVLAKAGSGLPRVLFSLTPDKPVTAAVGAPAALEENARILAENNSVITFPEGVSY